MMRPPLQSASKTDQQSVILIENGKNGGEVDGVLEVGAEGGVAEEG